MKAKYNASDNTLQELPEMEKPDDHPADYDMNSGCYQRCWARWDEYNKHIESLRTIPCSPEAATMFKDGEMYEEKTHYRIGFDTCAEHYNIYDGFDCDDCRIIAIPLPQPVQEDDLQKIFDDIKGQCQNSLSDLTVGRGLSSKDYVRIYEDSVFEFIEHLKKEYTLTRKP